MEGNKMYKLCVNGDSTVGLIFIKEGVDLDTISVLDGQILVDISDTDAQSITCIEKHYWNPADYTLYEDVDWTHNVMPVWLIKQKELAYQNGLLAAELAETTPDPVVITQIQVQIAADENETDPIAWYTKALANIDARAEVSKELIKEKLEALIAA